MVCTGMIAALDFPSFSGLPWLGVLGLVFFAAAGAAALWAATNVERAAVTSSMTRGGMWANGFKILAASLVPGLLFLGPLPPLLASMAIYGAGLVFVQLRDRRVPADQRWLTRRNLSAVISKVGVKSAKSPAASAKTSPTSVREWMQSFAGKEGRLAKPAAVASPKKGVAPSAEGPSLKFVKKDGTPILSSTEDGAGVSENIRRAQETLLAAIKAEATDVHVEAHEHEYAVRYRVDGVLQDASKMEPLAGRGLLSALKVIADMDIAERRRPQDGTFALLCDETKYDVRVASTPSSYGEKMVMRLLRSSGGIMNAGLDSIGLRGTVLKQLREIIHKPYGMFLVAGPTGSGKTTTVYASLSEIDAAQHNITTIEDPVEYRLDGITQISVNTKADVSFASILRSVLRQDPDVLLVGEIRDKETAEIACQAALTGHFVFSTVHANDTTATVTRLLELGLDPSLIQTAVTAVLGQRLARKLCPDCKQAVPPPDGLEKKFDLKKNNVTHIFQEKGCEKCRGTGYKGRMGIHELLVMNDAIRARITSQPSVNEIRKASLKAGTQSLQNDGLIKVVRGLTSINEILRVTT
jgi:general secretion pathway protein E